jgi:hypothetical protein
MKSGDHGNSHFAEEIAPAHQLRGIFFWLERKRSEQHCQAAYVIESNRLIDERSAPDSKVEDDYA